MLYAQTVRDDQLDQLADLGITVSFFPAHVYYWETDITALFWDLKEPIVWILWVVLSQETLRTHYIITHLRSLWEVSQAKTLS